MDTLKEVMVNELLATVPRWSNRSLVSMVQTLWGQFLRKQNDDTVREIWENEVGG
jgi:hypothetical protein